MADIVCDTRLQKRKNPLVVIVTHGDADGLVAATIVKAFEERINPEQSFLIFSGMDVTEEQTERLFDYICKYNDLGIRDKIYILDRPIPPLGWLAMGYLCDVPMIHIDHHITNHPDTYNFHERGKQISHRWSEEESAAFLSLEFFRTWMEQGEEYERLYHSFYDLAKATSEWDTFHWKQLGETLTDTLWKKKALAINAAEKLLGSVGFYRAIQENIGTEQYSQDLFGYFYRLQDAYDHQFQNAYDFAKRSVTEYVFRNHRIGVIYGVDVNYQSMIADYFFLDKKYQFDVIAFVNIYGTVSFRGKGNFDVSILAQKLGEFCGHSGGGHKNASGCKIYNRDRFKENLLELFYESMDALKLGNF